MPTWLLAPLKWVARLFLTMIVERLGAYLAQTYARWKRNKQIDEQAKQSTEPLKNAKTGQEIDDATDDALGHL